MTDPSMNATDPIADDEFPQIEPMDGTLPEPPHDEDVVDDADQPEPEDVQLDQPGES